MRRRGRWITRRMKMIWRTRRMRKRKKRRMRMMRVLLHLNYKF